MEETGGLLIPAATNQACCAILPNPETLHPVWLRSLYVELLEAGKGGAQPNWNGLMSKNLEVTLPLLAEQRAGSLLILTIYKNERRQ